VRKEDGGGILRRMRVLAVTPQAYELDDAHHEYAGDLTLGAP